MAGVVACPSAAGAVACPSGGGWLACPDVKCAAPSMALVTFTGLILCCGVTTLAPMLGVTFPVWFAWGNMYAGAAADFLTGDQYDGSRNCDPTTTRGSLLRIEGAFGGGVFFTSLIADVIDNLVEGPPLAFDIGGASGVGRPIGDGNIFAWEANVNGAGPGFGLPTGPVTIFNYHEFTAPCVFPDTVFLNNWIANNGTATIVPVCTLVTITSGSGGTQPAAGGTGSVTFTATNPSGGPGDWYATRGYESGSGDRISVTGSGTFMDQLTLGGATSGTGGATITFTLAANTTGSDRVFDVIINDKSFQIIQGH